MAFTLATRGAAQINTIAPLDACSTHSGASRRFRRVNKIGTLSTTRGPVRHSGRLTTTDDAVAAAAATAAKYAEHFRIYCVKITFQATRAISPESRTRHAARL